MAMEVTGVSLIRGGRLVQYVVATATTTGEGAMEGGTVP